MVFFVPPIDTNTNDGIRFHQGDEIKKLGRWIKSYLEMENIKHEDISDIKMKDRVDYVIKSIID
jgi:hypothetical protein